MSSNGELLVDDQVANATFTGGDWELTLENLKDSRPSKVARSADLDPTSTLFFFALTDEVTARRLVLNATNADIDAEYKVSLFSDVGFSSLIYTTGFVDVFHASADLSDPDSKGLPIIMDLGQDRNIKYVKIEIVNEDNADTFFEAGNLLIPGRTLIPTYNFAEGASFSRNPNTVVQRAVSGTPYFSRHRNIRSWTLSYPDEDETVAWDEIDLLNEICGLSGAVFVIPFPDDTARIHRQSFLGRLEQVDALQILLVDRVSTGFKITEYVG